MSGKYRIILVQQQSPLWKAGTKCQGH